MSDLHDCARCPYIGCIGSRCNVAPPPPNIIKENKERERRI
jgi:hypothetical protein